ncbi:MAG: S8 family serine peptidase [Chloroflexi bacterium]|nr:S8 family serine peptidase [Chloroflexota bacterium]
MQHDRCKFLALIALCLFVIVAGITVSDVAAQKSAAPIYLKAGTFTPAVGEKLPLGADLRLAETEGLRDGYYLVQFRGPVRAQWKKQVTDTGADLLGYIPDYAFKVRATAAQANAIAQFKTVVFVGAWQPGYKIGSDLKRDGTRLYRVQLERRTDASANAAAIRETGARLLSPAARLMYVAADSAQLHAIARIPDVAYIENFALNVKHNDSGAGQILGSNVVNANGYDGSTQTVAVADTGIGGGTAATAHTDIPATRVTAIYNWPGTAGGCFQSITDDGAVDVDSAHGTHTSGSVLSDGGATGIGKGTAPAAHLVFQATENWVVIANICKVLYGYPDGYYLTGIPSDLHTLFQQAYTAGARIHSNSWGSAVAGDYTTDSANADDFIWDNKDFVITFSAGNEGIDANADGIVDNDSIGSPATAKNVITVGASENQRSDNYPCDTSLTYTSHDAYQSGQTCSSMSGANWLGTYGSRWPSDYPANPIASDSTAGNQEQMAAFSSRGPTDDTRIKPDVVAPGTWILSTSGSLYQEGYGDPVNPKNGAYAYDGWGMPYNVDYKWMGGTSMSNPIAAGGAAVIKDYYSKAHSITASAALVKATLINSAVDMLDENNDGVNDNDYPIPNNHEGWGRVNLINATDGSAVFVDNSAGLATGGNWSQAYTVPGGQPFKVTVVWSDFASTDTASVNLVNNLDLTVSGPGGVTYKGNVFSGGWSATGGSADTRNNVENVYVQSAAAGTWTVTVNGLNVPSGPQPFAIVIDGSSGAGPTPTPAPPTPTPTPTNTPVPSSNTGWLSPTANAAQTGGDNNGYQTSPTNAYSDNAAFAVDTNSGNGTSTSCTNAKKDKHNFYNYNVSIPGTVVDGIEVRLDAKADATSGAPKICIQLSWDGGATWTTAKQTTTLTTGEVTYTLGGAADTWSRTWTTANFSNTNFRVRVINVASSTARDFSLDWVAVRVTYH